MTELLTAMDVANQQFRRSLRGYDPRDVDEFLDRVSETIHAYAEQYREEKRRAERLEEQISEYTELKDSLQDALVMAQQSAEERVKSAEHQASTIVEEAQSRAERLVTEAQSKAEQLAGNAESRVESAHSEIARLDQIKKQMIAELRGFHSRLGSILDAEQSEGGAARQRDQVAAGEQG